MLVIPRIGSAQTIDLRWWAGLSKDLGPSSRNACFNFEPGGIFELKSINRGFAAVCSNAVSYPISAAHRDSSLTRNSSLFLYVYTFYSPLPHPTSSSRAVQAGGAQNAWNFQSLLIVSLRFSVNRFVSLSVIEPAFVSQKSLSRILYH
jgi:hypothetical protein